MTFEVIFIDLILNLGKYGHFQMKSNPKLKHIKMLLTSEKNWIVGSMLLFKLKYLK